MRNLHLLIAFLTFVLLCQAAHAVPIPGDLAQLQVAANTSPNSFQISYAANRNSAIEASDLFGGAEPDPKPMFSVNRPQIYLAEDSGTFNILTNTAAPLPEPPSLLLLGTGILVLAVVWRLRRSKV